jgi:Ca-activated chloride channel family protein
MPVSRFRCAIGLILALFTFALFPLPAAAASGDQPGVMILFDGSGSMWGRLEDSKKVQKLDAAREALKSALATVPEGARVGLMFFGHRRSGDCSDIEVLTPLAAGDASRIMTPLDKLNPRGKGPIAGALREAAKALSGDPRARIILIHDNADNCRADPCEVADDLARTAPALRVHVVSVALDRDELERVACIAKVTGGQAYDVRDASGLASAISDAMRRSLDGPNDAATVPIALVVPVPAPAVATGAPGLKLSAKLSAEAPPLALPVQWRVTREGASVPDFEATGASVTAPLPAGRYSVEARIGYAVARVDATAADAGPTPVSVALNAGALRVNARNVKDGDISASALVSLTPAGATVPLWIGLSRDADFILPAGTFDVRVSESLTTQLAQIVLTPGAAVARDIISASGQLELSAVAHVDGEPLDGVTFILATDDPDAPDGRREIARSAARQPVFTLPSGTYYVTARTPMGDVRQRVGIGAGDRVKRAIPMGFAKISVSVDLGGTRRDPQAAKPFPTLIRVMRLDGDIHEVARSRAPTAEFTLPTGRFRIEASIDASRVRADQEIEIESSNPRRVALKLDGALVTLKFSSPAGSVASTDVTWEVKDAKGASVARSFEATPRLVLAPGRYTALLDVSGRQIVRNVDMTADGQSRTIDFQLP